MYIDRKLMGKRIKERRELSNLTQEQVGNKIGKKFTTVAKYESGEIKNIDVLVIDEIAEILDTNLDYFLLKTNIPERKENLKKYPLLDDIFMPVKYKIFGYKIKNNEMAPLLDIEDIAVIDTSSSYENGKTFLIKYNNKELIRKIIDNNDGTVTLQAMNPYYPIIKVNKKEIDIIGKVIKAENSSAFI